VLPTLPEEGSARAKETAGRGSHDAVIFDFGGVLTSPLIEALDGFASETGIELQDVVRAALGAYAGLEDQLVTDFEIGRIGEKEFSERFAARLESLTGRAVAPEGLVARMFRLRLEETMFGAVARLRRAGIKTALVSNAWGEGLYPRARLEAIFDAVLLSNEVGLRKPDPDLFRLAAQRLNVAPGRCIVVDDHPGHLEVAAREGMTPVLHVSPQRSIDELEELLAIGLT
jgi:putative hydrolase of the HAD superfamily